MLVYRQTVRCSWNLTVTYKRKNANFEIKKAAFFSKKILLEGIFRRKTIEKTGFLCILSVVDFYCRKVFFMKKASYTRILFLWTALAFSSVAAEEKTPAEQPAEQAATQPAKPAPPPKPKPPRVRTGVITQQNFSSAKPEAEGKSPLVRTSSKAWAVLTLTLDAFRAVSIFDYALRKDGTEYKCLDLAEGTSDPFRGSLRNYRSSEAGKVCRLVFAIPSAEEEYEIIFKLKRGEEDGVKLNIKPPPPPPEPAKSEGSPEGKEGEEKSAAGTPAQPEKK